jgi:chaperonin GroEL
MIKDFNNDISNWNVIEEADFKNRVRGVFEQVSNALSKTLGPYGSTTIIEQFGEMHITKDGWQVLKNINFDEAIDRNIMQLLLNISAQVVIKVGDGSTSSIIAANSILKQLENSQELKEMRPKEFMKVLSNCVRNICDWIQNNSKEIYKENDATFEEIFRLAMISTNGDEEISKMIQTIYQETRNPSIQFVKSKTNLTTYEIIDGYKANITYLSTCYINNDEGICNINNPLILMFDHKIDEMYLDKIIKDALQVSLSEDRRLVVIAPYYDQFLLKKLETSTAMEIRSRNGTTSAVYTRVSLINNLFINFYNDFCMLTGGMMVTESVVNEMFSDNNTLNIKDFLGRVGKISIGAETTLIQDFFNRNEDTYNIHLNDAISKFKVVEERNKNLSIVTTELYEMKQRVSKLYGKMGIINVGGGSSLEKTSNYDLVDDAVKACESAFNYGYNIGGNLIIPIAIDNLASKISNSDHEKLIYDLLSEAFKEVFYKVIENKYNATIVEGTEEIASYPKLSLKDRIINFIFRNTIMEDEDYIYENDEINDIVDSCINDETCYDLINDEFTDKIINSCQTDIEILKAATSIVSLLISSNQYITIKVREQ